MTGTIGCTFERIPGEALCLHRAQLDNLNQYVAEDGSAICTCHPVAAALDRSIVRFPCDGGAA